MAKAKEENFGKFDSDYQKGRTKKKKDGSKVSASVDAGGVVMRELGLSLPDSSGGNSELKAGIFDATISEPIVSEPVPDSFETLKYFKSINENAQKKADDAVKNNERMDEIVERENEIQGSRRQEETMALELIRPELLHVFPEGCRRRTYNKDGTVFSDEVSREELLEKFLEVRSTNVRKFLLRKEFQRVAREVFSFFQSDNFLEFLGIDPKNAKERNPELSRVAKALRENGLNRWSNRTELQRAGDSALKMTGDLEGLRHGAVGVISENTEVKDVSIVANDADLKTMNEDGVAGGFGVVAEPTPEIPVVDDIQFSREVVGGTDEKEDNITAEEKTFEGNDSEPKESLDDFRSRVSGLKNEASIARDTFFAYRHRNDSRWRNLKKYFSSLRSSEPPQSLVDERKFLESNWNYKLTLYKDARVALAKREAMEGASGRKIGEIMAETIRELDFQNAIENYNAWKDASWGDRKDSWALRAIGRAKDWGEWYRKLDWKKRIAFSGLAVGIGVTGVVTGSMAVAGMGVAGSTLLRLLGSYGAGRGVYGFLEGYANKKLIQNKEEEISNIQEREDFSFLEERMREYAKKTQENFERRVRGNRNRMIVGAGIGALLFAGGTAWSLSHAMGVADRVAGGGKATEAVQKIVDAKGAGLSGNTVEVVGNSGNVAGTAAKGIADIPAGSGGSTEEMLRYAKQVTNESQVRGLSTSGVGAVEAVPPTSGTGGLASEAAGKIVEEKTNEIGKVLVAGRDGNSFERMFQNAGYDDTASHRAVLRFMNETGITQEKMDRIFNGAKAIIIPDDSDPKTPFRIIGITRESGGAIISTTKVPGAENLIQRITDASELPSSASQSGVPSGVPVLEPSSPVLAEKVVPSVSEPIISPTLNNNSPIGGLNIPEVLPSQPASIEPPDIFEKPTPDFESLDLTVPGSEYLKSIGVVVNEKLTFLPLSQTQKNLIESIFSARIPVSGTEPTPSSVLFVKDTLGRALFSSEDVERWMQDDVEHIKEKVNRAVYAGIVRIGGESLRIGKLIAEGETVDSWLTKMARYILTHPVEFKK